MKQVAYSTLGALAVFVLAYALGRILVKWSRLGLNGAARLSVELLTGTSLLSLLVLLLGSFGLARRSVFLALPGLAAALLIVDRRKPRTRPFAWAPRLFIGFGLLFAVQYGLPALAPPVETGAVAWRLPRLQRMAEQAGWPLHTPVSWSPDAAEAVQLIAFSIGKHSGANAVQVIFVALGCFTILAYATQFLNVRTGLLAAALFAASPVTQTFGATTSPCVILAAFLIGGWYLARLSLLTGSPRIALLLGLVVVNLGWTLAPLLSRFAIGPDMHGILDLLVLGSGTTALAGAAFLLTPIVLLRWDREQLWLLLPAAALTLLLWRFPTPEILTLALPFWSLGVATIVTEWTFAAPVLFTFHLLSTFPPIIPLYARTGPAVPFIEQARAALRIESEDAYLMRRLPGYHLARRLEAEAGSEARIWDAAPFPSAFHTRKVLTLDAPGLSRALEQSARQADTAAIERTLRAANVHWLILSREQATRESWFAQLVDTQRLTVLAEEDGFVLAQVAPN